MALVKRTRDGRYKLTLRSRERELLSGAIGQMRHVLEHPDPDDPVAARLFPNAYADDEEVRHAEWALLARSELAQRRLDALELAQQALDEDRLDEDELSALMRSVNDLRLTLGTQLQISEEMEPPSMDDPNIDAFLLYEWLGLFVHDTVAALSSTVE